MLTAGKIIGQLSLYYNLHLVKVGPHPRSLSGGEGGRKDLRGGTTGFIKNFGQTAFFRREGERVD